MVMRQTHRTETSWLWLAAFLAALIPPSVHAQEGPDQDAEVPAGDTAEGQAEELDDGFGDEQAMEVNVSPAGVIEMHIQNGDLYTVLQRLLLKTRKNIVFGNDVSGTVTVSLFDVTLDEALDVILRQNGYGFREECFIFIYTLEEIRQIEESERKQITKAFRLNYITPADAQDMLEPFLSPDGQITAAPAANTGIDTDTGGQSLAIEDLIMVRDYEENIQDIERNLILIDKRPKQVLLEATILSVELQDTNTMGIDFNILGGVDFEMLEAQMGSSLPHGPNIIGGTQQSSSQGGQTGGQTGGQESGATQAGSAFGELANTVPQVRLDDFTIGASTGFSSAVPQGGLRVAMLTDTVSIFIRAIEDVSETTILGNPKVLVLNKQAAQILVGQRLGYRTSTVTATSETETVQFLESGTELRFRPYISNDGYVRLEVSPQESTGSISSLGLPSESTTEVTTNIIIKDGHTIVIGGMFREESKTGHSQIPFLGGLPFVGPLFGARSDGTARSEIVILLTVHIVDDEAYAEYSNEVFNDLERVRVGLRDHMMAHGRDRMAQAHYQAALENAAEGDEDLALWHTRMALRNRHAFASASRLKEDLVQKRSWEDEGSIIRDFVRSVILRDQGLPGDSYDRPTFVPRYRTQELPEPDGQGDQVGSTAQPQLPEKAGPDEPLTQQDDLDVVGHRNPD